MRPEPLQKSPVLHRCNSISLYALPFKAVLVGIEVNWVHSLVTSPARDISHTKNHLLSLLSIAHVGIHVCFNVKITCSNNNSINIIIITN